MKKTILITGASRGIGAATALLAAKQEYQVCINYRQDKQAADATVNQILDQGGVACSIQADISKEDDVVELFNQLDHQMGPLFCLVNNAGVLEQQTKLENLTAERIQRILNTNVLGSILCAREAVKRMSTLHGGSGGNIVNVSSGAARLGAPNEYIDYAASKGAIDSLTVGLSKEVAAENIRVNAVRPGLIYTDMHADGGEPGRVDRLAELVPMQRGGYPEEVAKTILWLASDEASYVTGSFIEVTGGR